MACWLRLCIVTRIAEFSCRFIGSPFIVPLQGFKNLKKIVDLELATEIQLFLSVLSVTSLSGCLPAWDLKPLPGLIIGFL